METIQIMPAQMREIEAVVRGTTPEARKHLVSILGEVVNVVRNLDVYCPAMDGGCSLQVRFDAAHALLDALNSSPTWTSPDAESDPLPTVAVRA